MREHAEKIVDAVLGGTPADVQDALAQAVSYYAGEVVDDLKDQFKQVAFTVQEPESEPELTDEQWEEALADCTEEEKAFLDSIADADELTEEQEQQLHELSVNKLVKYVSAASADQVSRKAHVEKLRQSSSDVWHAARRAGNWKYDRSHDARYQAGDALRDTLDNEAKGHEKKIAHRDWHGLHMAKSKLNSTDSWTRVKASPNKQQVHGPNRPDPETMKKAVRASGKADIEGGEKNRKKADDLKREVRSQVQPRGLR